MVNCEFQTSTGPIRKQNEDNYLIEKNTQGHRLLVVADGMGGHNGGEVASYMACEIIQKEFLAITANVDYKIFIKEAINKANNKIYKSSLLDVRYSKMGTTISLLIWDGEKIYTGHVGDSRIYFINHEQILQITKDHTLVQAMVESGTMDADEVQGSKLKNVLIQALGTSKYITIEIKEIKLPHFFNIVLCSDGLTGMVSNEVIKEIINEEIELKSRLEKLVAIANKIDGSDNVTVVSIENRSI